MLLDLGKDLPHVPLGAAFDLGAKAHGLLVGALFDDLIQTVEGAAADEEDVAGVHVDKLLVGVLPSALGRDVGNGALQQL